MKRVTISFAVPVVVLAGLMLGQSTSFAAPKKDKAKTDTAKEAALAEPAAPAPSPAAMAEAKQIFSTLCFTCHGSSGHGDGAAAAALNPKPRDFTSAEWQMSVKDAAIEKSILEGGAAVGKSPTMPGNPQLKSKPEVVAALRALIRSFGK